MIGKSISKLKKTNFTGESRLKSKMVKSVVEAGSVHLRTKWLWV